MKKQHLKLFYLLATIAVFFSCAEALSDDVNIESESTSSKWYEVSLEDTLTAAQIATHSRQYHNFGSSLDTRLAPPSKEPLDSKNLFEILPHGK